MAKTFFYRKTRLSRETPVTAKFIPESGSPSELRVSRFETGLEYSVPSNLLEKVPAKVELTIDGKVVATHTLKGNTPAVTPGGNGGNVSPPVSNGVLTFGKGIPLDNPDVDAYLDIDSGQLYRWENKIQDLGEGVGGYVIDDNRYGLVDSGAITLIPSGEEANYGVIRTSYSTYASIHGLEPTSEFAALAIEPVESIAEDMELVAYIHNALGDREDLPAEGDVPLNFGIGLVFDIEGMGQMIVPAGGGDLPPQIEIPQHPSILAPGIYSFGVIKPGVFEAIKTSFEEGNGVALNSLKIAPIVYKSENPDETFVARWRWAKPGSYSVYRERSITHHLASGPAT